MSLCPFTARAHDPFESWISAVLRPDRLELTITMAQSTALKLIDPQVTIRGLTFANFAEHRALLEKEAAALCVLTADRKRLAPTHASADLTEENDVLFKISYARPPPGRLHFHTAFLKKLGDGYGGILEASDTAGNHLGWEQVTWEYPNFEITLPPAPKPKSAAAGPPRSGKRELFAEPRNAQPPSPSLRRPGAFRYRAG